MIDVSKEIEKITGEYLKECDKTLESVTKNVAEKGLKQLKQTSPTGVRKKHYKTKWKIKAEKVLGESTKQILHVDAPDYRLTHLLEYGHMTRGGNKRTKAIPHIKPVETFIISEVEKELRDKL